MSISVLVIEDQAALRDAVRVLLEGAGYVVYCAENPIEALGVLARVSPPCIVLWDTLGPTHDFALVDEAIRRGVQVATLPVSVGPSRAADVQASTKRLTSHEAILSIVREHCPKAVAAIA
jgi:two-component system, OmpR family, response regulator CpxR